MLAAACNCSIVAVAMVCHCWLNTGCWAVLRRVVKTAKQTVTTPMTYTEVVKMVIEKDGVAGLFGRGLRTKIIANGIQVRRRYTTARLSTVRLTRMGGWSHAMSVPRLQSCALINCCVLHCVSGVTWGCTSEKLHVLTYRGHRICKPEGKLAGT